MKDSIIKGLKPLGFMWETRDPFLFCVHHKDAYPRGNDKMGPAAPLVSPGRETSIKNGPDQSRILLLQGKPIAEPVVQHGPFVMNTQDEIQEAFEDYQRTRFGGWPWDRSDPVNPSSKGRFARYADGTEENKD
ncbi:MAG: hypothetical protein HOK67_04880 [Deltaproteobacteria bacterium]|jgi:hypothetical protein|nr:hypothetical protein [Deltaproteobacteria bacterium]MBT4642998.1 hypothetical protein [Deltaproteobacteria bacterium]MBT6499217.1 hypothetical protein [Deltaproteobacteria bacterium]MBT7154223.1 hypothetical protein [Deltaproteobacteria bacterium]MBT7712927.1 hypothetical protein [Deltaproteobacteria bacterium]